MNKLILLCGLSLLVLAACSSTPTPTPTPTQTGNRNGNVTCKNAAADCDMTNDDGSKK